MLVEIRFLLDEDDRRRELLTRRNELLDLTDRYLKRREAEREPGCATDNRSTDTP